jgi:two-component system response regulator HydG
MQNNPDRTKKKMAYNILVIDDDTYMCNLIAGYLQKKGYITHTAIDKKGALEKLAKTKYHLVLCDYRLPDSDGKEMLEYIRTKYDNTIVVIITAYSDVKMAVKLIKAGATDYLTKPLHPEEILEIIKEHIQTNGKTGKKKEVSEHQFIEGKDHKFQYTLKLAETVAPTDMSVIIQGETGVGKEYIARRIHSKSLRNKKPFVAVDCGALTNELAGSELFGHIKGAFTGAIQDKTGYFQQAKGGTIFLDEIANLNHDIQMKLLRALQEKVIYKTGDINPIKIDVRILVASNENIFQSIQQGKFREDLYYRLNEFDITIPPLRERKEDIPIYTYYFLEQANKKLNKSVNIIDKNTHDILLNQAWYGNLRELKNFINKCVLLSDTETLDISMISAQFNSEESVESSINNESENLKYVLSTAEKTLIINALKETNNNKSKAAKLLKIDRKTLYNKMKVFDIKL